MVDIDPLRFVVVPVTLHSPDGSQKALCTIISLPEQLVNVVPASLFQRTFSVFFPRKHNRKTVKNSRISYNSLKTASPSVEQNFDKGEECLSVAVDSGSEVYFTVRTMDNGPPLKMFQGLKSSH